jgi:type I restriction enzyme S subunit
MTAPTVQLKRLADIRFSSVDKHTDAGEEPVRLCNYVDVFKNDRITDDLEFMQGTATTDEIRRFRVHAGDVLITKDSEAPDEIGIPAFVPEDLEGVICGYHLAIVRADRARIDPRYLYWALASEGLRWQFSARAMGITRFGLRHGEVGNVVLSVPPLDRQEPIANLLDRESARIHSLVSRRQALVALLRERRQALIDEATVPGVAPGSEGWPIRPLRKLAGGDGLFTDGDWIETPFITDVGIRLIQTGNIGTGTYREQGFRYVSPETFVELGCTEVRPGDVLICRLADPVGRACLAPDLGVVMITSVDVCILRPDSSVDSRFLVAYLSSSAHLSLLESIARGGTRDRVSREQLGQVSVPLPPLEEQRLIADRLYAALRLVDSLERTLTKQIDFLAERRQAVITAAVTGQIDVAERGRPRPLDDLPERAVPFPSAREPSAIYQGVRRRLHEDRRAAPSEMRYNFPSRRQPSRWSEGRPK